MSVPELYAYPEEQREGPGVEVVDGDVPNCNLIEVKFTNI